jgi:prepilin-type N-terminal cleavage/methylation domain-containing protein
VVAKKGFSLIELIIAIVIISIAVLSMPLINSVVASGVAGNIVQEAVFAASTELNEATNAFWDKNSLDEDSDNFAKVINIDNDCNITTKLRPGHIDQSYHRLCLNNLAKQPSDTKDTTDSIVTIDDMRHDFEEIFINATPSASGYKKSYQSKLEVQRGADFGGNNQNVKKISITIRDDQNNTIVKLYSYSFNIGEVDYFKKEY